MSHHFNYYIHDFICPHCHVSTEYNVTFLGFTLNPGCNRSDCDGFHVYWWCDKCEFTVECLKLREVSKQPENKP